MAGFKAPELQDFAGDWGIERHISAYGSSDTRFVGQAVWRPDGKRMRYREVGQLMLAGQKPLHAERAYLWTPDLKVYFPDGRLFHQVLTDGRECIHLCDPDTYKGRYNFTKWPLFTVAWEVSGPQKAYRTVSTYRRL